MIRLTPFKLKLINNNHCSSVLLWSVDGQSSKIFLKEIFPWKEKKK